MKKLTSTTYLFDEKDLLKALKLKGKVTELDLGYAEDFNDSDEDIEDYDARVLAITVRG